MSDPKQPTGRPMSEDPWGVGQNADGSINVVSPEDFPRLLAEREADEAAFSDIADDEGDLDDVSDLDDDEDA